MGLAPRNKRENPDKGKKKVRQFDKRFADLWPGAYYDEEKALYVNKDGTCFDFLRVKAKDINNISGDEVEIAEMRFERLYRTLADDIKIVFLNYPCNTSEQVRYFQRKIKNAKNAVYIEWLNINKRELEYLHDNTTQREYFIMVMGVTPDELERNRDTVFQVLGTGKGLCEEVPAVTKHDIVSRMVNKSDVY